MKLSEYLKSPDFKIDSFLNLGNKILYFEDNSLDKTKQNEIEQTLYKVVFFSRESKNIGIIIIPKYPFTMYRNGVIIEHPNFVLKEHPSLVTVELIFFTKIQFITNQEKTATIIAKSLSDTPNY